MAEPAHASKVRFLDAALHVIRAKGYTATRIDDVCEAAGLTKGSFFHHFKTKEDLALAAVEHFGTLADRIFAAPFASRADPVDRLLGYVDFRIAMLSGELSAFTCLAGTMVQEAYATQPPIREACARCIHDQADSVAAIIAEALASRGTTGFSAASLALHTQAVILGAFVLAKADGGPAVAVQCLQHLRHYIELLFTGTAPVPTNHGPATGPRRKRTTKE